MIEIKNILPDTFYQPLFNAIGEGMVVVAESGEILLANERVLSMFGYDIDEIVGQSISILIPKKFRSGHGKHMVNFFKDPRARLMSESRGLLGEKKNGKQFPLEISLNHFVKDNNTYAVGLITDISDRKVAEKKIKDLNEQLEEKVKERTNQLLSSQKLYNAIARNFPDGTINVFDQNLNYVFVEGKELFKLGITSEKLLGSNYIDRLPDEISKEVEKQLRNVFKGEACNFEIALNNNYYVLDAVPLANANGEVLQILVIEKNIADQKFAENEMKKNLLKEQELNNLKSRFVSMASHEFRTPLGAILSSASLIGKYTHSEEQPKRDKHVKRIKSSVENLTRILDDFLSFDRLESGRISCLPGDFDVKQTCEAVIDDMQGLLKDGQEVAYKHEGDDKIAFLDRQLFGNILVNLLSNAIKYSMVDQIIYVKSSIDKDKVGLSIVDHGMGIPQAEQQHLFERFFRAKNAVNIQGTGLGLNIVKKYVDLLNGSITYESKENIGTSFFMNFPKKI